jgi:hypothetical protein
MGDLPDILTDDAQPGVDFVAELSAAQIMRSVSTNGKEFIRDFVIRLLRIEPEIFVICEMAPI